MQTKKQLKVLKQKGVTLIEALAYLAIAAVVIGGAIAMFFSSSNGASSNQVVTDVNALKATVKSQAMAGQPMTGITTTTLSNGGRLSKNMTNSGGAACGALAAPCASYGDGTAFKITGTASNFTITVDGLSTEVCDGVRTGLGTSGTLNTPTCAGGQISFTYR